MRSMGDPDYVYQPWSEARRRRASKAAKKRLRRRRIIKGDHAIRLGAITVYVPKDGNGT